LAKVGYASKVIGEYTIFPSSYMIPTRSCRRVYWIDAFLWPLVGKGGSSVGLRCNCVIWQRLWRPCAPTSGYHPGSNFLTFITTRGCQRASMKLFGAVCHHPKRELQGPSVLFRFGPPHHIMGQGGPVRVSPGIALKKKTPPVLPPIPSC